MELEFVLLFLLFSLGQSARKKDIISMKGFGTCQGHKVPNGFFNVTVDYIGRGQAVINGDLIIREPAKQVTGLFVLLKCRSQSRENCEEMIRFGQPDLCQTYLKRGQYFTSLLDNIKPRHKCPLVLNTCHRMRNATFDTQSLLPILKKFPNYSSSYWLMRCFVYRKSDNLELNCVDFLVQIEKVIDRH